MKHRKGGNRKRGNRRRSSEPFVPLRLQAKKVEHLFQSDSSQAILVQGAPRTLPGDLPQLKLVHDVPLPHLPRVLSWDRAPYEEFLRIGSAPAPSTGETLLGVIGIDCGTSSTKVVVRFPEEPGAPGFAVEFPDWCRAEKCPHLWSTFVWAQSDGTLTPWADGQGAPVTRLKTGIMSARPNEIAVSNGGQSPTYFDAAIAYLAYVIRYSRGWLISTVPEQFRGRRARWLVNVGLPSQDYDNELLVRTYRNVAAAAVRLADSGRPVTVMETRRVLSEISPADTGTDQEGIRRHGIGVIPELAAEVAGFAQDPARRADGLYVMIDVGAGTLDVCTFNIGTWNYTDQYSLFAAEVKPLGVAAEKWFLDEGLSRQQFIEQCTRLQRRIVNYTRVKRAPTSPAWRHDGQMPVFLCGGGARNALHRGVVDDLDPWLKKFAGNRGMRLMQLATPKSLKMHSAVPHDRLAVAWGLGHLEFQIGTIVPPSDIDDLDFVKAKEIEMVGKEMT